MRVKEVAALTGVEPSTVRYYARRDLLKPERHPSNGYRVFSATDVARLRIISNCRRIGLTLEDVRELLVSAEQSGGAPEAVLRNRLTQRARELDARIAQLHGLHDRMRQAAERWTEESAAPSTVETLEGLSAALARIAAEPNGRAREPLGREHAIKAAEGSRRIRR